MDLEKIQSAIQSMHSLNLHGNEYTQVQQRVEAFRKHVGTAYSIHSEILVNDGKTVLIQANIQDKDGRVIATGLAEELRGSSNVNKTSPIENCETSAWGRALANLGLHGGKMASVEEIQIAKNKEKIIDQEKAHDDAVRAERNETNERPSQRDLEIWAERIKETIKDAKQTWQLKKIPQDFANELEAIKQYGGNLGGEISAYHKTRWDQLNDGVRRT
tara:strand:+ start:2614 stop:3264 length:651 start_codon:yes stop_codon:yes gene_type:complete